MNDFIAKKREIFLVQMSLDTKRAEITKLEERALQVHTSHAAQQPSIPIQPVMTQGLVVIHRACLVIHLKSCINSHCPPVQTHFISAHAAPQHSAVSPCSNSCGDMQREEALKKSEQMLEEDALRFDAFLKENDEKVQEAIKKAEVEAKAKQDRCPPHAALPEHLCKLQAQAANIQLLQDPISCNLLFERFTRFTSAAAICFGFQGYSIVAEELHSHSDDKPNPQPACTVVAEAHAMHLLQS